jgi:hypothetical protein
MNVICDLIFFLILCFVTMCHYISQLFKILLCFIYHNIDACDNYKQWKVWLLIIIKTCKDVQNLELWTIII